MSDLLNPARAARRPWLVLVVGYRRYGLAVGAVTLALLLALSLQTPVATTSLALVHRRRRRDEPVRRSARRILGFGLVDCGLGFLFPAADLLLAHGAYRQLRPDRVRGRYVVGHEPTNPMASRSAQVGCRGRRTADCATHPAAPVPRPGSHAAGNGDRRGLFPGPTPREEIFLITSPSQTTASVLWWATSRAMGWDPRS